MADKTQFLFRKFLVLLGRLVVNIMATQATHILLPLQDDFSNILHHVSVGRVQLINMLLRQIYLHVAEQVVTGDEVVRKWESRAARETTPNVALTTNGCHHLG